MEGQSPSVVTAALAIAVVFILSAMAKQASAAVVEHTFVVSQMKMTHLCKDTLVTVVNGQLPGPVIEVTEGDSVVVHVVNQSPHNITIHWHGVKQRLNCWMDGVPMITQCPILPGRNFTYRFNVTRQEGTLWWHAHVFSLRGTLHGAFLIRPRHGADSYPFPKPHSEIPIVIGDWWDMDLEQLDFNFVDGFLDDHPTAATINGKLGDLFNCSGIVEDGFVLDVEAGKTYLLRVINAVLFSEYYLRIAGHKFTVVAADANYVRPYTTDMLTIAPGETVDALVTADAPPARYYMVAKPNRAPLPDPQIPMFVTRATVRYKDDHRRDSTGGHSPAVMPDDLPDEHDTMSSFYFHGNLNGLYQPRPTQPLVPARVDERLFVALGLGTLCRWQGQSCHRRGSNESFMVATMNNISYHLPTTVAVPLMEAQYYHHNSTATSSGGVEFYTLPDRPPRWFNFTDSAMLWWRPKEMPLVATKRATVVRRFKYGSVVEVVFQSTALLKSDSNPMHLHGHDMFVLAQGLGNYNATRDAARYNLVDPPVRNTVLVPRLGWVAIRFVADNPGIWYMHCHYEFHLSMGMTALFIVEDGPTAATSLPPPPADFLTCGHNNPAFQDLYLKTKENRVSQVNGV